MLDGPTKRFLRFGLNFTVRMIVTAGIWAIAIGLGLAAYWILDYSAEINLINKRAADILTQVSIVTLAVPAIGMTLTSMLETGSLVRASWVAFKEGGQNGV